MNIPNIQKLAIAVGLAGSIVLTACGGGEAAKPTAAATSAPKPASSPATGGVAYPAASPAASPAAR